MVDALCEFRHFPRERSTLFLSRLMGVVMLRFFVFVAAVAIVSPALAAGAPKAKAPPPPQSGSPQCARDLALVDRSFAEALRGLQTTGAPDLRCTAIRRQIDTMKKASDVFARCTVDEARTSNISQMEGGIADFQAMMEEARCP